MCNKTKPLFLAPALAISLLVLTHLILRSSSFPYSPDSAGYFEQARNLVKEGAALTTPYGLEGEGKTPSALFPIGFPLVLSLFQLLGIDARETSVALSWFASVVFPVVLFLSFRRALGQSFALIVAALSASSPSFLAHAGMGLTDIFSLLVAGVSLGLVINTDARPLIIAGLLAGAAYSVRNAHVALLVSVAIYFLVIWFTVKSDRRETVSSALWFATGAAVIIIPLFVRNIILFGSINPYQMEHSTISVLENIRTYLQEFVYDITAYRELGRLVSWSVPGLSVFVFMLFLVTWAAFSSWGYLRDTQKRMLLLCSIYSFVGACVVIAARSRYQWGEPINVRHTLQYTPFFMAIFVLIVSLKMRSGWQSIIKHTLALTLSIIVVIHLVYAVTQDSQATIHLKRANAAISAFEHGKEYLCENENNNLLISNFAYVFKISCNADVRQWDLVIQKASRDLTLSGLMADSLISLSKNHPNRHIVVGFYRKHNDVDSKLLPISVTDTSRLHDDGWNVINNDDAGLLVSR